MGTKRKIKVKTKHTRNKQVSKYILKNIIFTLVTITWGAPTFVIGVFYYLYNLITRNILKTRYIEGRVAITTKDEWLGGISLGLFYFVGDHDSLTTHYHEIGHTVQNVIWGPLFLIVIGLPSIIRASLWSYIQKRTFNKKGKWPKYDDIWFEGQATHFGYKYFIVRKSDYYKHFNIDTQHVLL